MTNLSTDGLGWISNSVTKNPEGLLLVAAGVALLLRSGSSTTRRAPRLRTSSASSPRWERDEQRDSSTFRNEGKEEGIIGRASEYVSEVSDSMSEKASDYASAATEYVNQSRRTVVERTGRFADEAQSTLRSSMDRVLQDQPLAVALAGLTAGALVAAAFPSTQMERDTLGTTGERLADAASTAGERLSKAASVAGDELAKGAEEKGLNTDGLKSLARDVSDAFETELSGGSDDSHRDLNNNEKRPGAVENKPAPNGGSSGSQPLSSMNESRSPSRSAPSEMKK